MSHFKLIGQKQRRLLNTTVHTTGGVFDKALVLKRGGLIRAKSLLRVNIATLRQRCTTKGWTSRPWKVQF